MRTIKFRGKRVDNGQWLFGHLLSNESGAVAIVPPFKVNEHNECSCYEVDPDTVEQFTGLVDKNGKEIYEGDILRCKGKHIYEVYWSSTDFSMRSKNRGNASLMAFLECEREVIGNIHDNLELMKGVN